MEYPRLVYKSASAYALVENDDEYNEKIKEGWFGSVPEALAGETIPVGEATRDELIQKAKELGLKFGGNTGNDKLKAMIEEAL
jgi:hypothetical protein